MSKQTEQSWEASRWLVIVCLTYRIFFMCFNCQARCLNPCSKWRHERGPRGICPPVWSFAPLCPTWSHPPPHTHIHIKEEKWWKCILPPRCAHKWIFWFRQCLFVYPLMPAVEISLLWCVRFTCFNLWSLLRRTRLNLSGFTPLKRFPWTSCTK